MSEPTKPRAGMRATHKTKDLDTRTVSAVSPSGRLVWLAAGKNEIGPFPAENYHYKEA